MHRYGYCFRAPEKVLCLSVMFFAFSLFKASQKMIKVKHLTTFLQYLSVGNWCGNCLEINSTALTLHFIDHASEIKGFYLNLLNMYFRQFEVILVV